MASVTHNNDILSGVVEADQVGDDATHYGVYDGDPAADPPGNFLFGGSFTNDLDAAGLGDRWRLLAGEIVYTQAPAAGESEVSARRKLRGLIDGGLWVTFHSGNPGITGVNRIEVTAAEVAEPGWTIT